MPPEDTSLSSCKTCECLTLEKEIQLDSPPSSTIELAHCIVHVWMFFGQEGVTSALASYATQVVRRERARPFSFYIIEHVQIMSSKFLRFWTSPPLPSSNSCNLPSFGQNLANTFYPLQCRCHMYIAPYVSKLIHLSFNGIASSADVVSGIGSAP